MRALNMALAARKRTLPDLAEALDAQSPTTAVNVVPLRPGFARPAILRLRAIAQGNPCSPSEAVILSGALDFPPSWFLRDRDLPTLENVHFSRRDPDCDCGEPAPYLCDGAGCDAPICQSCAATTGHDRHLCPACKANQ